MRKLAVLLSVVFMLSGCGSVISQSEYDNLIAEKADLEDQIEDLNSRIDELTVENKNLASENKDLIAENESLHADIEESMKTSSNAGNIEYNYCANLNSGKFHRANCRYLPAQHNQSWYEDRDECISDGYVPCKVCNP